MKNAIIILVVSLSLIFIRCNKNQNFLIKKGQVGLLTKTTKVYELATIFANDSLVVNLSEATSKEEQKYFKDDDEYLVYDKEGKHLLTIIPIIHGDSLSTLKSIEIFSNKYKTKEGISLYSPYKDIQTAYPLDITNTILSAHIDIDALNATMSINKKDIGINQFNRDTIKPNQIPDLVKVNHFTIWFN